MTVQHHHPETLCESCGRRNPTWSVDSDRWNAATVHLGREVILCPPCFVDRHEDITGLRTCWHLTPGTPFIPMEQIER